MVSREIHIPKLMKHYYKIIYVSYETYITKNCSYSVILLL